MPELMLSDICSLGTTFFTMINPSLKCPFLLEIRSETDKFHSQEGVSKFFSSLLRDKRRPLSDAKYSTRRASVSSNLEGVYIACTNFDPAKRPSLLEIDEILSVKFNFSKNCDQVELKIIQS